MPSPVTLTRRELLGVVSGVGAAIVVGHDSAKAEDPVKADRVKVEVVGEIGSILRQENSDLVTATVRAGGGEFIIDGSESDTVKKELVGLANEYIKRGSSVIILHRVRVTGRLEFRATKVIDDKGVEADGPRVWVLVADSVQ